MIADRGTQRLSVLLGGEMMKTLLTLKAWSPFLFFWSFSILIHPVITIII